MIWGIGNSTYRALLVFVPFYGLYVLYQLGRYGSRWAWRNRLWEDQAHFVESQRRWAKFGAIYAAVVLLLGIGLFVGAALLMKNNGAFKDSMILLRTDPNVVDAMGEPIHDGWFVTGQISIGGDKGFANLVIPVSGPKCEGDAASRAGLLDGEWVVYSLIVNLDCLDTPITVVRPPN